MLKIILDTPKAISTAKTKKSMNKTILVLLVSSLLAGLSSLILTSDSDFLLPALGIVAFFFVYNILFAFFVKLGLKVLTKKGGYYEALTALSYGFFVVASGVFVTSLLMLISNFDIPALTIVVSIFASLITAIAVVLGKVIKVKTAMELFGTDLITVVFSIFVVYAGLFFAFYISVMGIMFSMVGTIDPAALSAGAGYPITGLEGLEMMYQ